MKLRPGQMLSSPVDTTAVVVVRAPADDVEVTCAGVAMYDARGGAPASHDAVDPTQLTGSQLGKRYADGEMGIELLCCKAGQGTLAAGGTPLTLQGAKPLPASD